ncbi:MAG: hypothetical protein HXY40_00460 [Chloroflexi bacterium]|nr:hypothetical protein [Chloroflexota bacterium]
MNTQGFRWAVILILFLHGVGHIMGFFAAWTDIAVGFNTNSWIFSADVPIQSVVGKVFGLLWLAALLTYAWALWRLLMQREDWRLAALMASILSLGAILPWWNSLPTLSALGATFVDLVVLIALLPAWGYGLAQRLAAPQSETLDRSIGDFVK